MQKQAPIRVVRTLEKSPYVSKIGIYEFVFSSDFNRRRFRAAIADARRHLSARCNKLYGMRVEYNAVSAFALYVRIERRGFLVRVRYGDAVKTVKALDAVRIVADVNIM